MDMLLYAILNKKIKNSGGSGGGITPKKLENVDLNTVTETGFYYGFEGHGCTNTPSNAHDTDFSMIVVNGDGIIYQIFTRHRDIPEHRLFQRSIDSTDASDIFVCEWAEFATTEDCTVDSVLSETSTRPPQNAIVTKRLNEIESNSAKKTDISGKQDKLTAGTNITIDGNVISAKDTTYNDATQSAHGLMTAADKKKLDGMDLSKYLPKSGGAMTGAIDTVTNGVDITVGSNRSNNSNPTLVAGGSYEVSDVPNNALKNYKSLIGTYHNTKTGAWFNMISVRHKNGYGDGFNYGMYLYSALTSGGNLIWNKQTEVNTWQGERTLLDSVNYASYALDKDGTAKKAATLTDSGWIATTRDISYTEISTVKCRKYGQLVEVRGEVTFRKTYSYPIVCTLPDGYSPADFVQTCGCTPSGKIFGIKVDTAGVVSFSSDADGTFVKDTTYRIDLTYLLG